jgi:dienelactone hydrolase
MAIAVVLALATAGGCSAARSQVGRPPSTLRPIVSAPATTGSTTTSPSLSTPPTTTEVGTVVLPLVDRSRPTVSHGRLVASSRTLTTQVWYPKGVSGSRPLVVFAHGFQVGLDPYRRACNAWAQRGFVVAAPIFPLTDQAVAGANLDEADLSSQPADVRFVITQLLAATKSAGSPLRGLIDPARIAVVGHSDGAETALLVGYGSSDRDPRVDAVIADAAKPLDVEPATAKIQGSAPLLIVLGDQDRSVPIQDGLRLVDQVRVPGWLLVLHGADHLSPIAGPSPWTPELDRVTGDFLAGLFSGSSDVGTTLQQDAEGTPSSLTTLTSSP